MADLPSASVVIDDAAGAFGGGTGFLTIFACVGRNADMMPRVMASSRSCLDEHDYAPGVDLAAMHFDEARTPVLFVPLPIDTQGAVGRINSTGVTGSSAISISAGASGALEECDASIEVVNGGTVGTNGITFNLSLDGGVTTKLIRLGTATSYVIPYVGLTINFGGGSLNAGDVYTFSTTAPMWAGSDLATARANLAAQLKLSRSWMVIGDLPNHTFAGYVTTEANGYETADQRFVYARASVKDRTPLAAMSRLLKRMTGGPNLTFSASGHTITRAAGSFVADGFAVGDEVTIAGSSSNDGSHKITTLTDTVMTFASGLADEGPVGNVSIVGSASLVFDGTAHTITRSAGSFLNDGFAVGDSVTLLGTSSNNVTKTITTLTATVMTFAAGLVNETVRSDLVTMTKGETMSAYVAAQDAEFSSVDAQKRIDLSIGRARKFSPITGWEFRRPAAWAASLREYQHDLQIPCWRKSDGPCDGFDLTDADGNPVEFDERSDGGGLAARFTCFRTYGNGPRGAFIALSLTRDTEGSLLSRTHNMAVANLACTVTQAETENAIGQVLVLKQDGTGTDQSLSLIEERINSALQVALLQNRVEGQRASSAVWRASRTDILDVPGAELTGTLDLRLNGTLEKISTRVRIQTAG